MDNSTATLVAHAASLAREAAASTGFLFTGQLVRVAEAVARAADRCDISGVALQKAADCLASSDAKATASAAAEISRAAAEISRAAAMVAEVAGWSAPLRLATAARDLEMTAKEFSLAAVGELMKRKTDTGRSWLSSCKKEKEKLKEKEYVDLETPLLWNSPEPSSTTFGGAPGGRPDRSTLDGRLSQKENQGEYLGYALLGSLTLLPYLGPEGAM